MRVPSMLHGDLALGLALALATFILYLTTLSSSVGFTDAGELATVAATVGIAHPTGYPLWTVLAAAFAKLPLGGTVIGKLNLLAALCCTGAVFFFFRFFLALLRGEGSRAKDGFRRAAAAIAALSLAVSRTFWEQSTGVEVYSLHLLLIALALFLFVRALQGRARLWPLFAYVLGLSFANHMTTVLLLPGLAFLCFATWGFGRPAWLRLGRAVPPFLAGLSLYLYLPVRAAAEPLMNWGNPVNLENFWRHVSGRQYSVWMFSSLDVALAQLAKFIAAFPSVWGWAALVPMALGLVVLSRRAPRLAAFTVLLFAGCVAYAVNYDIHDISSYFLLAHAAAGCWLARGALALLEAAGRRRVSLAAGAAALGAACALPPLAIHHRAVDASADFAVEDYSRGLLASLEPDAAVVTYQWDVFVSAAWYLQEVEDFRPDVTILERELLRRSWYVRHLMAVRPRLTAPARPEMEGFHRAVGPFERGEPYDGASIQVAFEAMVRALLRAAAAQGPLYALPEVERVYLRDFTVVPDGMVFRLLPPGASPPPVKFRSFSPRPIVKDGPLHASIREGYARAWVNEAFLQGEIGNFGPVRPLLNKALALRPGYPPALELLRQLDRLEAGSR